MKKNHRFAQPWGTVRIGIRAAVAGALSLLILHARTPSATLSTPTPGEILSRMEQRFEAQIRELASYQSRRAYSVEHSLLEEPGRLTVEEQYSAPGERTFRVIERSGSSVVHQKVFSRLLEVEQATTPEPVRRDLDLNRRNYQFTYERYDPVAGAYIFTAEPRGSNPYLLRGKVWINAQDFGVQRIEGKPVERHSVFVRQTHFIHEFARFGEFWFPVRHQSETDLFLFGRAVLRIRYYNYHWQERHAHETQAQAKKHQAKQEANRDDFNHTR